MRYPISRYDNRNRPVAPSWTQVTSAMKYIYLVQGKVYIVTGANTGLGYAAAKALAAKNARVYMASRSRDKQQKSVFLTVLQERCSSISFAALQSCCLSKCLMSAVVLLNCVCLMLFATMPGQWKTLNVSFQMLRSTGLSATLAT